MRRRSRTILAFVPMYVRFALDRAGRKIGLAEWTALAPEVRHELAERALAFRDDDGDGDDRAFAERLDNALAIAGLPTARALAPLDVSGFTRPSDTLHRNVVAAGGALDEAAWPRLSTFDRYALFKLGDRDAPSHDLAAALDELGLRPVGIGGGRVDAAMLGEVVAENDA